MDKVLISRLLKIGGIIAAFAILFAVDAWLYENKNSKLPPVRSELEEEEQKVLEDINEFDFGDI